MDAEMKIKIGADTVEVTKSLDRLKQQLKTFEEALGKSTDAKRIDLLNRSIEKTRAIIAGVKGFKLDNNLPQVAKGASQATFALTNLSRVAQDAPFGFIGIANNIEPLIQSFVSLKNESGGFKGALSALGASLTGGGGLILLTGLASAAMSIFGKSLFGAKKEAEDAKETFRSVADAQAEGVAGTRERILSLQTLTSVVKDTSKSEGERLSALREIKKIDPEITQGITLQAASLKTLTDRVNEYTNALIAKNIADEFGKEIGKLSIEEAKQALVIDKARLAVQKAQADLNFKNANNKPFPGTGLDPALSNAVNPEIVTAQNNLLALQQSLGDEEKKLTELSGQRKVFEDAFVEAKKKEVALMQKFNTENDKALETDKKRAEIAKREIASRLSALQLQDTNLPGSKFNILGGINDKPQSDALNFFFDNLKKTQDSALKTAATFTDTLTPAINSFFQSIASGSGSPFKALGEALKQLLVQLAAAVAKALIFKAILSAIDPGAAAGQSFMSLFKSFSGLGSAAPGGIRTGGILGSANRIEVTGGFRLQGSTLVAALRRANTSFGI